MQHLILVFTVAKSKHLEFGLAGGANVLMMLSASVIGWGQGSHLQHDVNVN